MASRSNGRSVILLVVCGLLLAPAYGGTPNANASRTRDTIVTLPVGEARPSAVAIAIPDASLRVTPSKLVSRRDLEFRRADVQWQSFRLTFLMYKPDSAHRPAPVAVVSSFHLGESEHVWIQRIPRSRSRGETPDVEIATIEHLYGVALGQNPHAVFCLNGFGHECLTPVGDYAHPMLLRQLSDSRQRVVTRAHRTASSIPWRNVMMASEPKGTGYDRVGVRVTNEGAPLQGATVFFNRAPHSGCSARSSPDGLVTCDLMDQHGDEESHDDQAHVPILATFPGDVRSDRILLPTTLTWYLSP